MEEVGGGGGGEGCDDFDLILRVKDSLLIITYRCSIVGYLLIIYLFIIYCSPGPSEIHTLLCGLLSEILESFRITFTANAK